ncbi:MAG: glycine--tRNA ligase subunit beta [Reyranellaceae bacterium]
MAELLLELLSEEIPARMQARAAADLERLMCDGLKAAALPFASARSFATARRLALVVDGLPAERPDVSDERRGPRVGAPVKAIEGFLKAAGLESLDQAEKRDTGKGEFWFAVVTRKGGPTAEALPVLIGDALAALPWPKSMKWGSGSLTWVRPLQSVIALFDGQVLDGAVSPGGAMAPIPFGDSTRGHRFLSRGTFAVTDFADYQAKLRAAHVVLDPAERKRIVLDGAHRLCAEAQVALRADEGLLDEVAGLAEWPVPLLGTIDAQFMDVPPEVLIVSMRTHQRYFATVDAAGALANRFVVVANNLARDGGRTIVDGNERVLRARLSDAKFFWDQDRKSRLETRLPVLKDIVFHAKLGSQADRVLRLESLADRLAAHVPGADAAQAVLAAHLCKVDLVSGMVGEFPELQGTMGRYYALAEGQPAAVAEAIGDHYAPAGPADRCPSAPLSIVLALADKLDTLTSFWAIGEKPTGSRDPFALRRAALGIIRIVVENRLRLPLRQFCPADDLMAFFAERLKVQMREKGVRHDVVDAVLALGGEDDLVRLLARVEAVQSFLGSEAGRNLLTAYGRAANIVRAEERKDKALAERIAGAADPALFAQDEERRLHERLAGLSLATRIESEDFAGAMAELAGLREPIDAFFEKVTVNVDDNDKLRVNRLKLLNQIRATMDSVADFSRIEG